MRVSLFVAAVLVSASACARATWEGEQALSRTLVAPPDSVAAAARRALVDHGYAPMTVSVNQIVTRPHDVPMFGRTISTAPDTLPQQWVIEVQADSTSIPQRTRLTVVGFLIPRAATTPTDTAVTTRGVLVTADNPRLFAEVQRVGNWIVESVAGSR